MKAIICRLCSDIRALSPKGVVTCRCGNVFAWWVDAEAGIAKVCAKDKDNVAMLGLANDFLVFGIQHMHEMTNRNWQQLHDRTAIDSEGYLFHRAKRDCWAILFSVGSTNDVSWGTVDELERAAQTQGGE